MFINLKEKELVAIGASVAAGCKPCTNYHFNKVQEAGASNEEIKQAISDAMCVRDSAKKIMEAHGLKQLGVIDDIDDCDCSDNTTRIKELVSISAAFAVNCSSNLEKHITAAQNVGITDDEIKSVIDLTLLIKNKAASHVDRIALRIGNNVSSIETTKDEDECGCDDDSKVTTTKPNKEAIASSATDEKDDCGCGGAC